MASKLTTNTLNISQYLNIGALTQEEVDAISPLETGLFVFNTTANRFEVYDANISAWKRA